MRILVTDSDTRAALAAVRALGRHGHQVTTAGHRQPSLASASRFSSSFDLYPDPSIDSHGFIFTLASVARRREIDIVLPMTEITTLLVTEHQSALPTKCQIPFPDSAIVSQASNKAHVLKLAEQLGVPIPLTLVLECAPTTSRQFQELPYPVIVKPARSRVRAGSTWLSTSVSYAPDPAALWNLLLRMPAEAFPVLLQEKIHGPGMGIFVCFDDGRPVAVFAHCRVREKPPSGGVSVLCESVSPDPLAVEHAIHLLKRLRWHGVAMVEFKQDQRDGLLRLMEVNGRFWGSLQLAIDAGVDFPALAVKIAMGEPSSGPATYRVGVRSRWLAGDLDSLVMTLLRSRRDLNLSPMHARRLKTLWDFLHLWGRDLNYEIEQSDDFGPARLEWGRRLLCQ